LRRAGEWGVPPAPDPDVDGADAVAAARAAPPARPASLADPARSPAPPAFAVDGVHYLHLAAGGLTLLATTRTNVSPSLVLELLARVAGIVRDCCGTLSEEAVRRNAVLVYELLDEAIDGGLPVATSSEAVKDFVRSDPVVVAPRRIPGPAGATAAAAASLGGGGVGTTARTPAAVVKSVLDTARPDSAGGGGGGLGAGSLAAAAVSAAAGASAASHAGGGGGSAGRRDEIFVDVVERLSATFAAGGAHLVTGAIDGAVQVRSFLSGSPALSLALSDALVISGGGPGSVSGGGGGARPPSYSDGGGGDDPLVLLEDALFHDAVSLARFESARTLDLPSPPDGEFTAMSYRAPPPPRPPFAVRAGVEPDPDAPGKAVVTIRVRADFPPDRAAAAWEASLPFPPGVVRVTAEVAAASPGGPASRRGGAGRGGLSAPPPPGGAGTPPAGTTDWDEGRRVLTWRVPRLAGGCELTLRARASLAGPASGPFTAGLRAAVGPLSIGFAIPQLCVSGLAVRYLHVARGGGGSGAGALSTTSRLGGGGGGGSGAAGSAATPYRWVRYVTLSAAYTVRL